MEPKDARNALAKEEWDYVVLRKARQRLEGRAVLLEYARRFAEDIRNIREARMYMVWPSEGRMGISKG